MNKDVIYIEPEDDITDIITKIENSKEKIVALVPPKKASVFRSIVNLKLVAKAGAGASKSVVVVTTDPSIVKLAAAVKLPVTKDLKSAPKVPEAEDEADEAAEEVIEEEIAAAETAEGSLEGTTGFLDEEIAADEAEETQALDSDGTEVEAATESENEADETEKTEDTATEAKTTSKNAKTSVKNEKSDEKDTKTTEKSEKTSEKAGENTAKEAKTTKKPALKSNNPAIRWMQEHKKILIPSAIGAVVLIIALIWAFAIAPAAEVTVGIRTTATNFSENVSFTEKMADENASEGVFYLEEKKLENKAEVEFEATGKKNVGEKASGDVVVYAYFKSDNTITVPTGTTFTYDNKYAYVSQAAVSLTWDGETLTQCDNSSSATLITSGCLISARVKVVAEQPGKSYNISAASSGWVPSVNVLAGAYSDKAMAGGTDETITVVQQSDIDKAKAQIEASNENANKQKLLATIADDAFIIDASFKQTVGEAVSTPAVGEEVKDGVKPLLTVTTTDTIYIIDGTKVEEFIREKAKLADNFKIYEMNDPFIENFVEVDGQYVAKLKTSYVSGPKITEAEVAEMVKGKGVGTARQDLEKAYDGISRINIQTNYPWVSKIPNDNNKITVNIEVTER